MSALLYLLRTRVKNRLLALVKNPGGLVSVLLMAALLLFVVFTGNHATVGQQSFRDIRELYGLVLLLYAFIYISIAKNGLNKGTSLFSMADVNLLFASPVSNRRILMYGLIQQLGTSLLMAFFLLFQYSWMRQAYGVDILFIIALVLGYALTVFCGQLTAMVIYVFTSGKERRRKAIMWALVGICAFAAVWLVVHAYLGMDSLIPAITAAAQGLPLSLFPVAGWTRELVVGISTGNWLLATGMVAAVGAYIFLMVRVMTTSQADYYEDVLQATERSFSAISAAKDGVKAEALPDKVKIGKTGIGKGWGASAFFYKQRLESRRARRFILDPVSLIMLAVVLVFGFFIREEGLMPILIFATYMQFFTVTTGRWVRELLQPYVYMAPDSSFKKLFFCLMESVYKLAVEAALLTAGVALMLGLTVPEAVGFFLARLSFGLLFTAGMLLVERLFSGVRLKWLVMMIMVFMMILLSVPGIALAVWVSVAWPGVLSPNLVMTVMPALANVVVAGLAVFASRNVLANAEMNNQ